LFEVFFIVVFSKLIICVAISKPEVWGWWCAIVIRYMCDCVAFCSICSIVLVGERSNRQCGRVSLAL